MSRGTMCTGSSFAHAAKSSVRSVVSSRRHHHDGVHALADDGIGQADHRDLASLPVAISTSSTSVGLMR